MYDDRMTEQLSRLFETDASGQLHYAPPGSHIKVPVEHSEYEAAVDRLESRAGFAKIILFATFALCAALIFFLSINHGFEVLYLSLLCVPIGAYFLAIGWATLSSVRPFELTRTQMEGGLKTSTKWAARAFGAVVGTAVLYYIVRSSS